MSLVFLFVSMGYTRRLTAIGKTYQKLIDLLPEELKRIKVEELPGKFKKLINKRMSVLLCLLMFGSLLVMSVVMFIYYLIK